MRKTIFFIHLLLCFKLFSQSPLFLRTCKVAANEKFYTCAIGEKGAINNKNKQEGDLSTPMGRFPLREVYYRADKLNYDELKIMANLPAQGFTVRPLTTDDIWIDDTTSSLYNQWAKKSMLQGKLPRHEELWREDDLYDIIVVVGYNDAPIVKGKGSAIFIHVARQDVKENYLPTAGCIAFTKPDLLEILARLHAPNHVIIPKQANAPIVIR